MWYNTICCGNRRSYGGIAQMVRAHAWHAWGRWFDSNCLHQNEKGRQQPSFFVFIQAAGLAYHRRAKCGVYHQGRRAALVSHHAPACIPPAAWWYTTLRVDDIPQQVADDIQCFALMIYTPPAWLGLIRVFWLGSFSFVRIFTKSFSEGGKPFPRLVHNFYREKN